MPDDLVICDYLLLVATRTEEEELRSYAIERGLTFQEREGRWARYFDLGRVPSGSRILAVKMSMGPLSYGGSASRAIYCKTETQATGLICAGMAFGIDSENQRAGDVLVSRSVLPYDNRDIRSNEGVPIEDFGRVHAHRSSLALQRLLEREVQRGERGHAVHFGAILTGAARVFCRAYRDALIEGCKRSDPIVGGEMEAAGLLSVSERQAPMWIVVKGICDFADEYRDEQIEATRPLACRNAAALVLDALINEEPGAG